MAAASALGGLVFGSALLDAAKVTIDAGLIGEFSVSTALVFDLGVLLVVVGLVKTILVHLGDPEGAPR